LKSLAPAVPAGPSTQSARPARPARTTAVRRQQSNPPTEGFFKSGKGAVAIGLMAAGAVFTVWSINHDRKPVKSPVR
jgi:hypothetical protein